MPHPVYPNHTNLIRDLINHPEITYADTPVINTANEFATSGGARVLSQ